MSDPAHGRAEGLLHVGQRLCFFGVGSDEAIKHTSRKIPPI